jgi:hypothetical protein
MRTMERVFIGTGRFLRHLTLHLLKLAHVDPSTIHGSFPALFLTSEVAADAL